MSNLSAPALATGYEGVGHLVLVALTIGPLDAHLTPGGTPSAGKTDSVEGGFAYEEIAAALTVRYIQTPTKDLEGFEGHVTAKEAVPVLQRGGYDFAPLYENGHVIGRVALSDLEDAHSLRVGDLASQLRSDYLIGASATIGETMRRLKGDPWLLVVDREGMSGLITPSDLNRQASRTYFYLLIADFEIRLAQRIREQYPSQDEAMGLLDDRRRRMVRGRYESAVDKHVEVDLVAAMDLADLIGIAQHDATIQGSFGCESLADWKDTTGVLPGFRNRIMHPSRLILTDTAGLDDLIEHEARLRRLTGPWHPK
jgi:hypothetical protein